MTGVLIGRGNFRHRYVKRKEHVESYLEKTAIYKPRGEAWNRQILPSQPLEGTNPDNTLILDLKLQEL